MLPAACCAEWLLKPNTPNAPNLPACLLQTGQVGCAERVDGGFLLPISLCYVRNPANCIGAFQSTTYPGTAWKLC